MKKTVFIILFFPLAISVFAQRLSTVGIMPFEVSGTGVNTGLAELATTMVSDELNSWGLMTVITGSRAETAEYIVRGQIAQIDNRIVLTATTSEGRTGRSLNSSRETGAELRAISIESFCTQITENIPLPNFLLGTWQSTIDMVDGPLTCTLEFLPDRTVRVHRFDTWEHDRTDILKYHAIGTGTYTYAVYRRRTVNIEGRQIQADATIGVNLTLEDALPRYTSVTSSGLRIIFDENKNNFELVYGGIPCGDNYSGPSVYPGERVFYTKFNKIR